MVMLEMLMRWVDRLYLVSHIVCCSGLLVMFSVRLEFGRCFVNWIIVVVGLSVVVVFEYW